MDNGNATKTTDMLVLSMRSKKYNNFEDAELIDAMLDEYLLYQTETSQYDKNLHEVRYEALRTELLERLFIPDVNK